MPPSVLYPLMDTEPSHFWSKTLGSKYSATGGCDIFSRQTGKNESNTEMRKQPCDIEQLPVSPQWFDNLPRCDTELSRQTLDPASCLEWYCRLGDQLKRWIIVIERDAEHPGLRSIYGHRDRKPNWVAYNRNAWSAIIRDIRRTNLF